MTLSEKLNMAGGRPSGFDYLRIILACAVVVIHSVSISYGPGYSFAFFQLPGVHAAGMIILPMFFSLSGFLVSGSLDRTGSLFGFLGLRFIRIYPALTVEVLLSAFILGPLFTSYPLQNYFWDATFWRYLINVTGHISFLLPGVFTQNPAGPVVNQQLWTVPYELYCYFTLTVLAFARLAKRPSALLVATALIQIALVGRWALMGPVAFYGDQFRTYVPGPELVISFLAGVVVYRLKERLPWSGRLTAAVSAISAILFSLPAGEYLGVFTAAYATICLGLLNPKKVGLLRGADYSYGVYLYGWPIQQALVATGEWARHAIVNIVASLAIAFVIAALSWHFIEKPALNLRGPLKRLEARWLNLWRGKSVTAPAGRLPNDYLDFLPAGQLDQDLRRF